MSWSSTNGAVRSICIPADVCLAETAFLRKLKSLLADAAKDTSINVIVLEFSQETPFADARCFERMKEMDEAASRTFARQGQQLVSFMRSLKKPVIASVTGDAFGSGFEIALACDMLFAVDTVQFGFPEVNYGVIPGFGGTQLASRRIYESFVKYLVLTGEPVSARELMDKGIVTRIYADAEALRTEVAAFAENLSQKSNFAIGLAKETINAGVETDLNTALLIEQNAFAVAFSSADKREGMLAFIEKRTPNFSVRWEDFEDL